MGQQCRDMLPLRLRNHGHRLPGMEPSTGRDCAASIVHAEDTYRLGFFSMLVSSVGHLVDTQLFLAGSFPRGTEYSEYSLWTAASDSGLRLDMPYFNAIQAGL